ncbi:substrate-binding periplasmic protein [Spirobacillus cienkowskii]|uniref:substrate-binding periplasmic protein n=1 Tax=Spirobacillus cienkowskii TaxID=495820 RepID=UPI0030CF514B
MMKHYISVRILILGGAESLIQLSERFDVIIYKNATVYKLIRSYMYYIKILFKIIILLFFINFKIYCLEIKVGLEPMPPLIIDENSGYTVKLLKEIEKKSNLKFDIQIMTYSRASEELKKGRLDLIGHTPKNKETKEFYTFAQELDFYIPTCLDLYMTKPINIKNNELKKISIIGTPLGNKDFFGNMFDIPIKNFKEGTIENLFKMLSAGRIDAFLFERASSMTTIKQLKINNIYYSLLDGELDASLAVKNDKNGSILKKRLDEEIKKINLNKLFKDYYKYTNLPKKGYVK